MIDHVRDPGRSARFYTDALAPLGAEIGYRDELVLDPGGHDIEAVCHAESAG